MENIKYNVGDDVRYNIIHNSGRMVGKNAKSNSWEIVKFNVRNDVNINVWVNVGRNKDNLDYGKYK